MGGDFGGEEGEVVVGDALEGWGSIQDLEGVCGIVGALFMRDGCMRYMEHYATLRRSDLFMDLDEDEDYV